MNDLQQIQSEMLDQLVELNKISKDSPILTGEKNLIIEKEALRQKVLQNKYGEEYIDAMESEANILVRQGLFNGYFGEDSKIYFDIPDWDRFISAIHAFYISYQEPEEDY